MKIKKLLITVLLVSLAWGLVPAQAAITTTGTPPINNNSVYQVGTTGEAAPYKEATNSFDYNVATYHFITQDTQYTNGQVISRPFTVNGITATYTVTVHVLPAYDSTQNNAGNPGFSTLFKYNTPGLANTTWFVDQGTYRDDMDYTALGNHHANLSLVGQDGMAPTLVRAPLKDGYPGYDAYVTAGHGEKLLRHTFGTPDVYLQNLVFDGNGRDMLPYQPLASNGSRNRGEYFFSINTQQGANNHGADNLVMRDITIQNLGASDYTTNTGAKNIALNFFSSSDNPSGTLSPTLQKNIERFTALDSVNTKLGYGVISSNMSNGVYLRDIDISQTTGRAVFPLKVEHNGVNIADYKTVQVVVDGEFNASLPLVYIQDVRYTLNTLPAEYRYVYFRTVNGNTSAPAILVSTDYADAAALLAGTPLASSIFSVFDRDENVWIVDENFSRTVTQQLIDLRSDYILKSSFLGVATGGNLSWTDAPKPLINIKLVASGSVDSFNVNDFATYPVNITAVNAQTTSAEQLAPVSVTAGAIFNLGASAANVKLYNFDFDALAKYTLQESINGVVAQSNPDATRNSDPYNGNYAPTDTAYLLNYTQYVPATTQAAKVTGSTEATFQNCVFTVLVDDLQLDNASINTLQDIPLSLTVGDVQALGVTGQATYSLTPALDTSRVKRADPANDDLRLYYITSDANIATVDADGTVHAINPGSAFIYVKAIDANNQGELEKPYARHALTVGISVTVTKTWENTTGEANPNSVTVEIKRNGASLTPARTVTLNAANSWTDTFSNLPAQDATGTDYAYTVSEATLPGYAAPVITGSAADGFTITNTRNTSSVTVSKVWENTTGIPGNPENVTVELTREGQALTPAKTATLNAGNSWEYTFSDLAAQDAAGADYVYDVIETVPGGYTLNKSGNATEGYVLTNTRKTPVPLEVKFQGKKVLQGQALAADAFTFRLTLPDSNTVTVKNAADGVFTFPAQTITLPGDYSYVIEEVGGSVAGMTYSTARYEIQIKVTVNNTDGELQSEITITKDGTVLQPNDEMIFENTYVAPTPEPTPKPTPAPEYPAISVDIDARKELRNRPLKAGEFMFTLKDRAGNVLERVPNAADGTIDFAPRRFSRPGRFLYKIEEVKGTGNKVTYDSTVYTARVDVTVQGDTLSYSVTILKDGVPYAGSPLFVNYYDPPQTGDSAFQTILLLLGLSVLVGGAWLITKKRGDSISPDLY